MFVREPIFRADDLVDGSRVGLLERLNHVFKQRGLPIEVVPRTLVLNRCAFDESVSFDVVEIDGLVTGVNSELTKIATRNEMLVLVGSHFVGIPEREVSVRRTSANCGDVIADGEIHRAEGGGTLERYAPSGRRCTLVKPWWRTTWGFIRVVKWSMKGWPNESYKRSCATSWTHGMLRARTGSIVD